MFTIKYQPSSGKTLQRKGTISLYLPMAYHQGWEEQNGFKEGREEDREKKTEGGRQESKNILNVKLMRNQ